MENTKHQLNNFQKTFFDKLSNYLDTKLYFFGSIQRNDYFPGSSDIDVDIFTENENSTIAKLSNYLKVNKHEFKKVVWKLNTTSEVITGYKFMYKDQIVILKFLFYKLHIIPDDWYIKSKKFILSPLIGKPYDDFVKL